MRREDPLPPEWQCLTGLVQYVKRVSHNEYSCSCPNPDCPGGGGQIHSNGDFPDRCRLFVDSHPTLWCRMCGLTAYPDQFGDRRYTRPSLEELAKHRKEREEEAEAKLRAAQRELSLLRDQRLWERYHDELREHERQWWREQGVPDCYQDLWGLGWNYQRKAASIPLFGHGWTFENIKYRLLDESRGKYRYHITDLPAPLFLCDPDMSIDGHVIAVEGEKKSMVLSITLDDPSAVVVGIPGLNPSPAIRETLSRAERVTLVLDPKSDTPGADGWSPMGKLVRDIGREKCRVLIPPVKIDDGILQANMSRNEVRSLLNSAVKI